MPKLLLDYFISSPQNEVEHHDVTLDTFPPGESELNSLHCGAYRGPPDRQALLTWTCALYVNDTESLYFNWHCLFGLYVTGHMILFSQS